VSAPEQDDPARGLIVAGVNDRCEPFVGIVLRSRPYAAPHGEDVWTVIDGLGDRADFIASQVCVVDDERISELQHQLKEATDG
jgi:hypothetical protein